MKDRRLCTQVSWHAWVFTSVASCLLWVLLVHLQPPQLAASAHNNTRHISGDWLFQHRFDRCDVMTCFENMNSLEGCRVLMLFMVCWVLWPLRYSVMFWWNAAIVTGVSEWVSGIHPLVHLLSPLILHSGLRSAGWGGASPSCLAFQGHHAESHDRPHSDSHLRTVWSC